LFFIMTPCNSDSSLSSQFAAKNNSVIETIFTEKDETALRDWVERVFETKM